MRDILFLGEGEAFLQVGAGTKGIVALGGHDERSRGPPRALAVHLIDDALEFGEQLAGDGIARLGPVQRDDGDFARVRRGDGGDFDGRGQGAVRAATT